MRERRVKLDMSVNQAEALLHTLEGDPIDEVEGEWVEALKIHLSFQVRGKKV